MFRLCGISAPCHGGSFGRVTFWAVGVAEELDSIAAEGCGVGVLTPGRR